MNRTIGYASSIRSTASLFLLLLLCVPAKAQNEISEDSLRKHVYVIADDSFEGRAFGTPAGYRTALYIAQQFEH